MQKEKDYRKNLSRFFNYYKEQCETFIGNHSDEFSGSYFSDWYKTKCSTMLQTIEDSICDERLDERVAGFISLYHFYIDLAQQQANDELLLENLFAIPKRMQREFSTFGFLVTEASTEEQGWWDEGIDVPNQEIQWTAFPDIYRGTDCSYQIFLESDLNNRALSFY